MGRARCIVRACLAASVAGTLCLAADHALAQGMSGGGGSGGGAGPSTLKGEPGARERFKYGGSFTGRMNLIAPQPTETGLPPGGLSQPSAIAPPSFAPARGQDVDPQLLQGLTLPKLVPSPAPRVTPIPAPPGTPAPMEAALPPASAPLIKQTLSLAATFGETAGRLPGGVKWRVFTEQPDANGEHLLVAESSEAAPRFELDPGVYIVHAVYGLVAAAKSVTVQAGGPSADRIILEAGAVRLSAFVGDEKAPPDRVAFTLTRDEGGAIRTVAERVRPDTLLRLPAGSYHVTSSYGDANAIVEVDLKIAAGKLVEAQVHHRAAKVVLKLVDRPGGGEIQNTSWTILTPGGDVIRDSIGALPDIVLAEGDYTAIARHDGRMYRRNFAVRAGQSESVEVAVR